MMHNFRYVMLRFVNIMNYNYSDNNLYNYIPYLIDVSNVDSDE